MQDEQAPIVQYLILPHCPDLGPIEDLLSDEDEPEVPFG